MPHFNTTLNCNLFEAQKGSRAWLQVSDGASVPVAQCAFNAAPSVLHSWATAATGAQPKTHTCTHWRSLSTVVDGGLGWVAQGGARQQQGGDWGRKGVLRLGWG